MKKGLLIAKWFFVFFIFATLVLSACAITGQGRGATKCTPGWKCFDSYTKAYQNNRCSWSSKTNCPNGCSNGACIADPCSGVTCSNYCSDSSTLKYSGACSGGSCVYQTQVCTYGCLNGACKADSCSGITCPNTCLNSTTLKYNGACSAGTCSYQTQQCQYGCINNACSTPPPQPASFVKAEGQRLTLDGQTYKFVGINRYNAAGKQYGYNCGGYIDPDKMFSDLKNVCGANVVRFWAFQQYAPYNQASGALDFSNFDAVIANAKKYGFKLIPVLENQWDACTQGGYKYNTWYQSGYLSPYGAYGLSFKEYVRKVVEHYKNEPTILMWQLINEAESQSTSGVADAQSLYTFAADMSSFIKSIDSNHLVSLGTIGDGQPGVNGGNFKWLHSIPAIDIAETHDYGIPSEAAPSTIQSNLADAASLNKPIFIGEAGIEAGTGYPYTKQQRADLFKSKMDYYYNAGGAGYLIWHYDNAVLNGFDFDSTDPLCSLMKSYPKQSCLELGTCPQPNYQTTVKFDWESGLDGWVRNTDTFAQSVARSTAYAKNGAGSLQINVNFTGAGWQDALVYRLYDVPENWASQGTDMVAYVYIPSTAPADLSGSMYIQDYAWTWRGSPFWGLTPGMWNELVWENAALSSVKVVGVKISSPSRAYTGPVYVDYMIVRKQI